MRSFKVRMYVMCLCCMVIFLPWFVWAQDTYYPPGVDKDYNKKDNPEKYVPLHEEIIKLKKPFDDPTDLIKTHPPQKILPKEIIDALEAGYNRKELEEETVKLVGFRAPDVVGKVAPEVKPGKYTYEDLEKYPGLKKLLPPYLLEFFKKPGPPFVGMIMDIEIEPTTQHFWCKGKVERTKVTMQKAKLDKDGYLVEGSWDGGVLFPRPSGPMKARQVLYNMDRIEVGFDYGLRAPGQSWGFDKNLKIDKEGAGFGEFMRLGGRVFWPPWGWYDERAKKNGEVRAFMYMILAPRASRGMNLLQYTYDSPTKPDQTLAWIPSLRRIRKLSATDTQDQPPSGGDAATDDSAFWNVKMLKGLYPYEMSVEEGEYLSAFPEKASNYIDTKNSYAHRNLILQRRPTYVLTMKQLDPSYIYSKRVYYIDKESFAINNLMAYDQKGRLYRICYDTVNFLPDFYGVYASYGNPYLTYDLIDLHSSYNFNLNQPAAWDRDHFTLEVMVKYAK